MNKFEIQCPHCGTTLTVQEEWIGMNVECPECKNEFTVQKNPATVTPTPIVPLQSAAAQPGNSGTFTFVCPSCNAVAELPKNLLGQQYECQTCFETAIAQAATERQCPYCRQTVKYHATVCKFCKADLTKAPPPSAPKPEETFIFICPECDAVEFLPVSMKGQQHECKKCCETSIAEPAEERKCPHCGEKIKIKAAICKHCQKSVKPLTPPLPPAGRSPVSGGRMSWGITEADAGFLRKIGLWLFCCNCISAIFSPIVTVSHISVRVTLMNLNLLLSFGIIVISCIWLYQMWKQVPQSEAKTTPGKAVGFLFIPLYNIYWLIAMPGWLSKHYNQFNESKVSLQTWWQILLGAVVFSFLFIFFVALTNSTSSADARAASEFFGTSNNYQGSGIPAAVIAAQVICGILNSALSLNWLFRMWKSSQKIPRIG